MQLNFKKLTASSLMFIALVKSAPSSGFPKVAFTGRLALFRFNLGLERPVVVPEQPKSWIKANNVIHMSSPPGGTRGIQTTISRIIFLKIEVDYLYLVQVW